MYRYIFGISRSNSYIKVIGSRSRWQEQKCCQGCSFYPNVTTLRSGLCYRKSVCLSSLCLFAMFVRPTQGVKAFGNIFSPLCILAILWPPCKILRRSSYGNPSVGALNARGVANRAILDLSKAISHKRYKIRPRVQLMTIRNDTWGIHWCNFQWPSPIRNEDFKVIGVFRCR